MRVHVVPADPTWPAAFAAVRRELVEALGSLGDVQIEHVGSTAVPGLAAKPVIDVDVIVTEAQVPQAVTALVAAGYEHRGEQGIPGRHAFVAPPHGPPRHVYVCVAGSLASRNHLAVRDVLRRDPALRDEYAAVKQALAARDVASVDEYVDGKTAVLQKVLRAAGLTPADLDAVAAVNALPSDDDVARADDVVRAAYTARADEYTAVLGAVADMDPRDVEWITAWASGLHGRVVDAGCGPGHWTDLLAGLGLAVEGVDLVPAFVASARTRFPGAPFRVGRLDDLGVPDGSLAGVLAWYSTVHLEPARLPVVLTELRRCLADDGSLLLGFFESDRLEPFPHTVTTAYSWPLDAMVRCVEDAGFTVERTTTGPNPRRPDRRHGALVARRRG